MRFFFSFSPHTEFLFWDLLLQICISVSSHNLPASRRNTTVSSEETIVLSIMIFKIMKGVNFVWRLEDQ